MGPIGPMGSLSSMGPVGLRSHEAHGPFESHGSGPWRSNIFFFWVTQLQQFYDVLSTQNSLATRLRFPGEDAGEICVLRKKIYNHGYARCNACVEAEQAEAQEIEQRNLRDVIRRK